jgi:hypothetical protein
VKALQAAAVLDGCPAKRFGHSSMNDSFCSDTPGHECLVSSRFCLEKLLHFRVQDQISTSHLEIEVLQELRENLDGGSAISIEIEDGEELAELMR